MQLHASFGQELQDTTSAPRDPAPRVQSKYIFAILGRHKVLQKMFLCFEYVRMCL